MHTPATIPPQPPSPDRPSDAAARAARFWTPRHVAEVTAGRWLHEPADLDQPLTGVSIDTRTLRSGEIFFAIAGPRFDGHRFLDAAHDAGAAMAIVEQTDLPETNGPVLHVDSTVDALQRLARAWRDVLADAGCRVIAVVGSNGKTTTRHLIHTALQGSKVPGGRTLTGTQSPRSFNNHLGVPLTLLAARAEHDFVIAELGTNHPGEITALAEITRPDAAVITSIGREHMEYFGSLDAVAREEAAVLDHVVEGGLAAIEADAWRQIVAVRDLPTHLHVVRFGEGDNADVRLEALAEAGDGLRFQISNFGFRVSRLQDPANAPPKSEIPNPKSEITLPLLGRHNATNALAAIVVGRWMGVAGDELAANLASAAAVPGRLETRRIGTPPDAVLILHDAYNANPDSMRAALATLAGVSSAADESNAKPKSADAPRTFRRIAVLGDMGELGSHGPDAHRQLGDDLAAHSDTIDRVLLVGQLTLFTAEALARHWPNERVLVLGPMNAAAADRIADMLEPGDVVLLKASRSVALERVLPAVEKRFEP